MNNNDIFKKLRVALQLRDDQIVEIMQLVDFRISKAELGAFFRNEDHPNFMECGDQVLRNFLNGLVIHLRGTKENPKNPIDVIKSHKATGGEKIENRETKQEDRKPFVKSNTTPKAPFKKKPASNPKSREKKPEKKIEIVEKVKFNNGKPKKK
ncbi:DUF1456 family protein [Flavobacterium orientale]|uniref:DUF1456 domain-containing protein n=1 Tax=Flavobacterium orientale TaxID=1756020 RepID=A0A916Y2G4_9FLAO|nr:DUF1456 family protein [Flavobacterium orientale]GGD28297.1 hypothetical protein GCM10011343_18080 [Flavobacterium orientale]